MFSARVRWLARCSAKMAAGTAIPSQRRLLYWRKARRMTDQATPQKSPRVSRRTLLRLGLLGGIVASGAIIYDRTKEVGVANWFKWMLRGQTTRFAPASRVALVSVPSYDDDLLRAIHSLWQNANAPDLQGANVVVKPNIVEFVPDRPCFTNPHVVRALIQYLRDTVQVKSVVIAEGMTFRRDPQATLIQTGYRDLLDSQHIDFVDLNYDDLVLIPLRGGYAKLDKLFMARTVVQADALISVPKLKTHHWTQISGSIKN